MTQIGMESASSFQPKEKGKTRDHRSWTKDEDIALVETLKELCNFRYKQDNGTFKSSYTIILKKAMIISCPRSNTKIVPHIESKIKTWKKHYNIIVDMIGQSGFGWNESQKCVEVCEDDIQESYLQVIILCLFTFFFYLC